MVRYSPFEYICIDIANNGYDDKKLFEERIQWVLDNFNRLTVLDTSKKERPLYVKAVMALFECCRQIKSGHMVGLDATCSGMSIMSVLTKCYKGCWATNLIDPDLRNDAYTIVTDNAGTHLQGAMVVTRQDAKDATMKGLYGSLAEPRKIFGEDTPELAAFYEGLGDTAPGAVELLNDLRNSWQSMALAHKWILPDNFNVVIKVMVMNEVPIRIDELDGSSFTHIYYVNEGTESGLKLVANVTHSFDAYLLRSLVRRCNYNEEQTIKAEHLLRAELERRRNGGKELDLEEATEDAHVYMARWADCRVPDAVILGHLNATNIRYMDSTHISQMARIANEMLSHRPFPIVTVHDEFKAHPNNCNQMRFHYVSILADLARGRALEDVFEQITGHTPSYANAMDGNKLADMILKSNYAIS